MDFKIKWTGTGLAFLGLGTRAHGPAADNRHCASFSIFSKLLRLSCQCQLPPWVTEHRLVCHSE
eukprot:759745-Hanusia_phi.AAC.3